MEFPVTWCNILLIIFTLLPFTPEAIHLQNSSYQTEHPEIPEHRPSVTHDGDPAKYALPVSQTTLDSEIDAQWKEFKEKHRPSGYSSHGEESYRQSIFKQNAKKIHDHNVKHAMGITSFTMGVNQFSDMTLEEFSLTMKGFSYSEETLSTSPAAEYAFPANNTPSVPLNSTVDWRKLGYVTPVKDQGNCGSCWAFSVTGALEGQVFRSKKRLVSLSEQNLVDCSGSYGTYGCYGAWPGDAYDYIKGNGGIDTEASYPYMAVQGSCKFKSQNIGAKITGWCRLERSESILQRAVATVGPISVAIDASHASFQLYRSGIYNEVKCRPTEPLDHAVLVVGYGTLQGVDYWIVKNSWGTTWGNKGYILMSRNRNNQCRIADYATYPTV